jgi:glycosyltransferase involved in cell wall biosynthesis
LQERYPAASGGRHAVYPHGHFMGYPQGRTRAEARRRLGLKAESTVFLQFGQIRAYKGFGLMLNAFRDLKIPGKQLVVAGRYSAPPGGPSITDRVRLLWLEHVSPRVSMHLREIANDEVQDYMAAADVLVLTHLAGLNSGVAVLGMSFGIPIVAPDLGCIPEVLGQGSNCIYPAGDSAALGKALLKATQIDAAQAWSRNRAAAASWTWDNIAHSVMAHLRSVA